MKQKTVPRGKPPKRGTSRPAAARASEPLKAKLVRIGNSRGVRLPKSVIEQAGLGTDVQITVAGDRVTIRPAGAKPPRAGWAEQIKKALAEHGDDIDEWRDWQAIPNDFDEKDWTW
jgi:antitoxin MazE